MTSPDWFVDSELSRRLRRCLVDELTREERISAGWQRVFAEVPRHRFIPQLFAQRADGLYAPLAPDIDRRTWLRHVYTNQLCVTQLNGDESAWQTAITTGAVSGVQSCTSAEPGLMAWTLERLELETGHRVLEIGAGAGYNAALLCRRLGDTHVTPVDIDTCLVEAARERLDALGWHPVLTTTDGRDGHVGSAPYDRIIATCSLPRAPHAWIRQLRPGGRAIVNLGGLLGGATLRLDKADDGADDGTAAGRFLPRLTRFLPARPTSPAVGDILPRDTGEGTYEAGTTMLAPHMLDDAAFGFLAWLVTEDAQPYGATSDDNELLTCLIGHDGSWAEVYPANEDGSHHAEQGGPRRLWTLLEGAYDLWLARNRPDWSHFGVTITHCQQRAWLETPAGPSWNLPEPTPTP